MKVRWLLLLLALNGCATMRSLENAPWYVAEEGGTRVFTPISQAAASSAAQELELRRRAIDSIFGGSDTVPPPSEVVEAVVLPPDAYRELSPQTIGLFMPLREPLLALQSQSDLTGINGTAGGTQTHELVHAYVERRIGRVPLWLNEGLAVWLQTMSFDTETITLGKIIPHRLHAATSGGRVALEGLQSWEQLGNLNQAETNEMYSAAWAWVAWLLAEEPDRMTRLLHGVQARSPTAWNDAFDGQPPTEQTLNTFLKFGRTLMIKLPRAQFPRTPQQQRAATPAEKYSVLTRIAQYMPDDPKHELAKRWAEQGLAVEPKSILFNSIARVKADGSFELPPEEKRRPVVALAPPSNPVCDDIESSAALEGRTHLRPRTWLTDKEDPWPQSTDGESIERRLELGGERLELLGASARARTTAGYGFDLEGNPRSPFLIVRRLAEGGSCVVGAWRAEMLTNAELRNVQTWVSKDKSLALALLGFTVGTEKRWVVLGLTKSKVWFALKSNGMTQAITPLARFEPNTEGTVDVVFGNVDSWRLRGETLQQLKAAP